MTDSPEHLLRESIERNAGVIMLSPAVGAGEAKRSRLLAERDGGVWLEVPARQELLLDMLRKAEKPVGVSFRQGEFIIQFASQVLRCESAFVLSKATTVEAVLLAWPTDIQMTQRRSGYRVKLPLDPMLQVRLWQIAEDISLEAVPNSPGIHAVPRDLSVGGAGVIVQPIRGVLPVFEADGRLRIELVVGLKKLLVSGRLRHLPQLLPDGAIRVGLNFDGMDRTIEGRRAMAQIAQWVAEMQRAEARRRCAG